MLGKRATTPAIDETTTVPSTSASITYNTACVDGVDVFYREAGPRGAPTIVLLHGFPSSSVMFATLIPLLADRYHLIAPDYPGFGRSGTPPRSEYDYTFDHLTDTVEGLLTHLSIDRYALYVQDYGGPIGMRLAMRHPERLQALVIQNANAYEEGLGPKWEGIRAFWADPAAFKSKVVGSFTSLEAAEQRHVAGSPHPERYDPSLWTDEHALLSRPGVFEIQADLLFDYRTNVAAYSAWQAWLRVHRPPTLVLWGKYDTAFVVPGALAYQRDVPDAEVAILEAGHFALDERVDEIARAIRAFVARLPLLN